jgi:hypothetical protein
MHVYYLVQYSDNIWTISGEMVSFWNFPTTWTMPIFTSMFDIWSESITFLFNIILKFDNNKVWTLHYNFSSLHWNFSTLRNMLSEYEMKLLGLHKSDIMKLRNACILFGPGQLLRSNHGCGPPYLRVYTIAIKSAMYFR